MNKPSNLQKLKGEKLHGEMQIFHGQNGKPKIDLTNNFGRVTLEYLDSGEKSAEICADFSVKLHQMLHHIEVKQFFKQFEF